MRESAYLMLILALMTGPTLFVVSEDRRLRMLGKYRRIRRFQSDWSESLKSRARRLNAFPQAADSPSEVAAPEREVETASSPTQTSSPTLKPELSTEDRLVLVRTILEETLQAQQYQTPSDPSSYQYNAFQRTSEQLGLESFFCWESSLILGLVLCLFCHERRGRRGERRWHSFSWSDRWY